MRKGVVIEQGEARAVLDNPTPSLFDRAQERGAAAGPGPRRGHHQGAGGAGS